ncbi:hypothetical protein [Acidovorax sp. BL-A-41-H1]|uniref:hypothetical protein n=1 Tax=Acidovorax sp. BL-A-41-H1 TaxID=3421102 RepID=UPI003F7A3A62
MTHPTFVLAFAPRPVAVAEFAAAYVGPRGPEGPGGGAGYVHPQATPLSVWTVAHNLGRRPSVTVTDHLGNVVVADVLYLDDDIVQVSHGVPFAGFAYCN